MSCWKCASGAGALRLAQNPKTLNPLNPNPRNPGTSQTLNPLNPKPYSSVSGVGGFGAACSFSHPVWRGGMVS